MAIIDDEVLEEHGGDFLKALDARRRDAKAYRDMTGSLPPWWEYGVALGLGNRGAKGRYQSPEQMMERVIEYFKLCADNGVMPTPNGLYAHLGFLNSWSFHNHARRKPEYRAVHAQAMSWLKIPLEMVLTEVGVNTNGIWKRLTNIPDGWELDEDATTIPLRFEYKDRRQQEVVGLDSASLEVALSDKSAAELFREMQMAGKKLAEERRQERRLAEAADD